MEKLERCGLAVVTVRQSALAEERLILGKHRSEVGEPRSRRGWDGRDDRAPILSTYRGGALQAPDQREHLIAHPGPDRAYRAATSRPRHSLVQCQPLAHMTQTRAPITRLQPQRVHHLG